MHLEKQAKLPGPGTHLQGGNLDLSGKAIQNSKMSNQPKNAFPVSKDRFSRGMMGTPDPSHYHPRYNFTDNVKS